MNYWTSWKMSFKKSVRKTFFEKLKIRTVWVMFLAIVILVPYFSGNISKSGYFTRPLGVGSSTTSLVKWTETCWIWQVRMRHARHGAARQARHTARYERFPTHFRGIYCMKDVSPFYLELGAETVPYHKMGGHLHTYLPLSPSQTNHSAELSFLSLYFGLLI